MRTRLTLIAVAAVVAAFPARAQTYTDPVSGPPSLAVWLQPLGTAFVLTGGNGLYLPLGASFRTSETFDVQMELTFLNGDRSDGPSGSTIRSTGFSFSIGPMFRRGMFFLSPKVLFGVQRDRTIEPGLDGVPGASSSGTAVLGHLGGDAGVELRAGGLMLGFAAGASGGVCRGCSAFIYSPFGDLDGGPIASGSKRFTPNIALNVNLLRVGAAF